MKKMKLMKWAEQAQTALNGRILSRRPRLYQSCSAIVEEEEDKRNVIIYRNGSRRSKSIFPNPREKFYRKYASMCQYYLLKKLYSSS